MPNKNSIFWGMGIGILSLIIPTFLLGLGEYVCNGHWLADPKIFLLAFIVPVLLLRHYMKQKQYMHTAGAMIFIMLAAMISYLLWLHGQQVI